jgi:hypothetical protein
MQQMDIVMDGGNFLRQFFQAKFGQSGSAAQG